MNPKTSTNAFIVIPWAVTLLISELPDILFKELAGGTPLWLFWSKVSLIGGSLLISLVWKPLRALWLYFAVLLSVCLVEWGVDRAYQSLHYRSWFANASPFLREMLTVQLPRATMGIAIALISLVLMGTFGRFFFVRGRLDAPAQPIPLVLTRPPAWHILGPAIAGAMCLGLLAFVVAFGRPPALQSIQQALPLLPLVLIFAASNAFGEEMIYRAPWLGALEGPVGPTHALLITAVSFGIGHFYGVPYGVLGVVMACIPGWLMGKAMIETRGFFWPWFIHFWMDVVVFSFIAVGSVAPGG